MVEKLYEAFDALYSDLPDNLPVTLPDKKTLAAEHTLAQEAEIYENSTKLTYRNVDFAS